MSNTETEYFLLVPVKIDLKEGKVIEVETVTTAMADEIFNTSGFFTSKEDALGFLNDEETNCHFAGIYSIPGYDLATRSVIIQGPDNCVDCDVSFEDYPEMRTGGSKCSTCSKE